MPKFVCIKRCTAGSPPRYYEPGKVILADECPKYFVPVNEAADHGLVPEDSQETEDQKLLSEVGPKLKAAEKAAIAEKMSEEPATVEEVAAQLGVDIDVVKEAAGRSRKNDKLTGDEVSSVKAMIRVAMSDNKPKE